MNNESNAKSTKQPLGLKAYGSIYQKIMTLEYEPGQHLEERHLMEQLNIGRTPVREALLRLEADFMVESQPGKGYIVRPITIQNTKAAFTALKILENGVAELAVRHDVSSFIPLMHDANNAVEEAVERKDALHLVEANSQFHQHYAQCSRNDYLILGLHKVRCETNRLAYLSFSFEIDPLHSLGEHYKSVVAQHRQMIECIGNRRETVLKKIINQHIEAFQNRIILYMSS